MDQERPKTVGKSFIGSAGGQSYRTPQIDKKQTNGERHTDE